MIRAVATAVLLVFLGGCMAPHYRENQLRALKAQQASTLVDDAFAALSAKRYADAAKGFREYLAVAPDADAYVFVGAATALEGNGELAEARALARVGLSRASRGSAAEQALRSMLVGLYARFGMVEVALSFLEDGAPLPEELLPSLARARRLLSAGDLQGAVGAYERVVSLRLCSS